MDQQRITHLTGELMGILAELESMYKSNIDNSDLAVRFRLPLSKDAAALETACQAINDAANVLMRAFPHD